MAGDTLIVGFNPKPSGDTMRPRAVASLIFLAILSGACGKSPTVPSASGSLVEPADVALGLGKHQQFELPAFRKAPVWSVSPGADGGYVSASGMYYAPLRAPADTTIQVVATFDPLSARASVHLRPTPPDSADCLGERQTPNPFGSYVEELPYAIVKVYPIYPDSARDAGVDGIVVVQALVCACGEVSETRVIKSIPMLDKAATDAVRKWIFKPATSAGEPVAVWVGVPCKFSLH
jgi:TonB family protein